MARMKELAILLNDIKEKQRWIIASVAYRGAQQLANDTIELVGQIEEMLGSEE